MIEMSRSVRSSSMCPSPCRNALIAMPNEPATTLSDLRMPKIPAVAIAPDADEPDVPAEDLVGAHRGDRLGAGRDDVGEVRAEIEDQRDEDEVRQHAPAHRIIDERRPMT